MGNRPGRRESYGSGANVHSIGHRVGQPVAVGSPGLLAGDHGFPDHRSSPCEGSGDGVPGADVVGPRH
ncbi:hypothetical protein [Arthrobacter bambusae]|uniref:hypothetical protein n=1 Tax=Arthrobacter bambusae TaxID=1338426 RepID=UPI0027D85A6B|nr:hypothetical protein [Arthrobacter bambusae]